MNTTASPSTEIRARDLDSQHHDGQLISITGWREHSITGRFVAAQVDFDGDHVSRMTLELEIDLAPGFFARCLLPVNGDYPVTLHASTNQ